MGSQQMNMNSHIVKLLFFVEGWVVCLGVTYESNISCARDDYQCLKDEEEKYYEKLMNINEKFSSVLSKKSGRFVYMNAANVDVLNKINFKKETLKDNAEICETLRNQINTDEETFAELQQ